MNNFYYFTSPNLFGFVSFMNVFHSDSEYVPHYYCYSITTYITVAVININSSTIRTCGTNIKFASLTGYVTILLFLMFCAPFHYRYLTEMADRTPKLTGLGMGVLVDGTPPCTPIPQASSTIAERYRVCYVYYVM
jgi:hypothetical protein